MPERVALINDATSRQARLSTPLCANGAESQPRPASVELLADQPLVQAVTGIEQDAVTHLWLRPDQDADDVGHRQSAGSAHGRNSYRPWIPQAC